MKKWLAMLLALILVFSTGLTALATESEEDTDKQPLPFTDVGETDWFFGDVDYVFQNGLMQGISTDKFNSNHPITRAMVVTVLYRTEGSPDVSDLDDGDPFVDLADGAYYADAVIWAVENGIVLGYEDGTFRPEAFTTREQLAVILHRYELFTEEIPPEILPDGKYNDQSEISAYARAAVSTLTRQGLLAGKPTGEFDPRLVATRAEFAAILRRYRENLQSES